MRPRAKVLPNIFPRLISTVCQTIPNTFQFKSPDLQRWCLDGDKTPKINVTTQFPPMICSSTTSPPPPPWQRAFPPVFNSSRNVRFYSFGIILDCLEVDTVGKVNKNSPQTGFLYQKIPFSWVSFYTVFCPPAQVPLNDRASGRKRAFF